MERTVTEDFKSFLWENRGLMPFLGIVVFLVYGIRIFHDGIFLDSEIVVLMPEYMHNTVWMGSNRFGLTFTSWLFGLRRLSPFLSSGLMALCMWGSGLFLSFGVHRWRGQREGSGPFLFLFPALFVSCPIFAEQYLFVLQSFEVAFAILLSILAAILNGEFVYGAGKKAGEKAEQKVGDKAEKAGGGKHGRREWLCLAAGLVLLVWSFGSYQSMFPFYVSLVLASFLLRCLGGEGEKAFSFGLRHGLVFAAACGVYGILVVVTRALIGTDSTYVSEMIHWKTDGARMCLAYIKQDMLRVFRGEFSFYGKLYFPAMCLFAGKAMYEGWKGRTGLIHYFWFLFGGGLFLLSPFYLTLLTGFYQPARSQLVYPLTSALFFSFLTLPPVQGKKKERGERKKWLSPRRGLLPLTMALSIFVLARQTVTAAQLFQTSWEVYRNDAQTANRMYGDICRIANRSDMENCLVIFTGQRDAKLVGPAVRGELIGLSLFEAEASSAGGVSGRVGNFFRAQGLPIRVLTSEETDLYQEAAAFMREAPSWPAEGSVQKMGEAVVVKLSE